MNVELSLKVISLYANIFFKKLFMESTLLPTKNHLSK